MSIFVIIWCAFAIFISQYAVRGYLKYRRYNKAKCKVYENINEETVDEFYKKLSHVSIVNHSNSCNELRNVFFT